MKAQEKIQHLRREIETFDEEILRLLSERAKVVQEVGKAKGEIKMDSYDPRREEEILDRLRLRNPGPFPEGAVTPVFREIISACRSLEVELTAAYLGPPATHSHIACVKHFGSSVRAYASGSIPEVFEAVERKEATYGVVPIENSTEGAVDQTSDLLADSDVKICGEISVRISHDLLSQTGDDQEIHKIYSHPQALGQCRQWLRRHFPHVPLVETSSTAKAAEVASGDRNAGAIATPLAAQLYGLKSNATGIEDFPRNCTRFLVLNSRIRGRTGRDKTSLLFSIPHTPGSLARILEILSGRGINLTKIESRPMKGKPWEYLFFVDCEGHIDDPPLDDAMTELKKNVLSVKLLGSYPRSLREEEEI
jgi:chorismate mutase/prephenate dehydratase